MKAFPKIKLSLLLERQRERDHKRCWQFVFALRWGEKIAILSSWISFTLLYISLYVMPIT